MADIAEHEELKLEFPPDVGRVVIEPLNHAFAAGIRQAISMGTPTHSVIEMLLNHVASMAAMVEPAGSREALVKQIVAAIAPLVRKHVDARNTTTGGVILPRAAQ